MVTIAEFENNYIKAINDGSAAVFAGAGIGKASGYMDWKGLLKEFAESIDLDVERENDLIEVAQYFKNEKGSRGDINSKILNEFMSKSKIQRQLVYWQACQFLVIGQPIMII